MSGASILTGRGFAPRVATNDNQTMSLGRIAGAPLLLLAFAAMVAAKEKKEFTPPPPGHARSYPAHDEQTTEKVTIAADPYASRDKAAIFKTNFAAAGFLPIYLVISNDGDEPVNVSDLALQLVTASKAKIEPSTTEDIFRRISHPERNDQGGGTRLPFPLPKKDKPALDPEQRDEINRAIFQARAVEPHHTQAGFAFFDVEDVDNPLAGARLYINGVRNAK